MFTAQPCIPGSGSAETVAIAGARHTESSASGD
jgi:hypothetical protein